MKAEEFWDRLDRTDGCWTWAGARDPYGYGMLKAEGRAWKAHRLAWQLAHGELPAGVRIVQTCHNAACCRPEHLVATKGDQRQRKPRRPSGSGSLHEVRPGVWELRVSVGRDPTTGSYERVTRMFEGNRTQAQRALSKLVSEASAGAVKVGSAMMDSLFDAWLAHLRRIGRSPNYITGARRKIGHNLRPAMGAKLARKVSVASLDQLLGQLGAPNRPGGPLSAATIRQHKQILSAVFTFAWKRDLVPANPVRKVDVPSVPQAPIVEPTIAEVIALMEAAEAEPVSHSKYGRPQHRPEMSTAIWLGAVLGVREAELCALKLDDFDWTRRRARVDQSVYVDEETGTGLHTTDTKGHRVRYVALDPVSIQVALEQLDWMRLRAEAARVSLIGNPFLFSDAVDASVPWRPSYVSRWFATVRGRCGAAVRPEVHVHCLRHFRRLTPSTSRPWLPDHGCRRAQRS